MPSAIEQLRYLEATTPWKRAACVSELRPGQYGILVLPPTRRRDYNIYILRAERDKVINMANGAEYPRVPGFIRCAKIPDPLVKQLAKSTEEYS